MFAFDVLSPFHVNFHVNDHACFFPPPSKKISFLCNLYLQGGARNYNPELKTCTLHGLSQPDTPLGLLFKVSTEDIIFLIFMDNEIETQSFFGVLS